jgi:hypothetical protein
MNAVDFWAVIHRSRRGAARDKDDVALTALTAVLAEFSDDEILDFDSTFRAQVDALDLPELREIADQLWMLSDDGWLHLRAWCVSNGTDFVDTLRQRGTALRGISKDHECPFTPPSGEIFLYCGEYARVMHEVAAT